MTALRQLLTARADVLTRHAEMLAERIEREGDSDLVHVQLDLILSEQRHILALLRSLVVRRVVYP